MVDMIPSSTRVATRHLSASDPDAYEFRVNSRNSRQQLWEPTGQGSGVRPVVYTYTHLQVYVFSRDTGVQVGGVAGSSEERSGSRVPTACERDYEALAARHPNMKGVVVVMKAFLDEEVRGKGVGLAMYRTLAKEAGRRGFAIVPNECWIGTPLTSADAKRVWAKLPREPGMDAEGSVVFAP